VLLRDRSVTRFHTYALPTAPPARTPCRNPTTVGGTPMTFEHQGLLFGHDNRFHEVARERLRSARAAGAHTFLVLSPHRASVLIDELPPDERARVRVLAHEELYDAPGRTLAALHRMALT